MFQDYKDLLSAFHAHGVRYLIVGGYAVIFHAQPRFTQDIDFFIKADAANSSAIFAALASFVAPLQGIRPEDFAEPTAFFRFGRRRDRRLNGSDCVLHFKGRSYCREARVRKTRGPGGGADVAQFRHAVDAAGVPAYGTGTMVAANTLRATSYR